MTIDEATKILSSIRHPDAYLFDHDELKAIQLGIEALKCIKEHRAEFGNIPYINLQGETKD